MPSRDDWSKTEEGAAGNRFLRRYLDDYVKPGSVLDWGDDPSFFAAGELLGDVRRSSWGVCRRDVRARLSPGDFVVFVCARESVSRAWDYYFVGVATLGQALTREVICFDDHHAVYRNFLNVLSRPGIDGRLEQSESVHRFHPDWLNRCSAPYWLFDPDDTALNVTDPFLIATYDGTAGQVEKWHTADERVQEVRSLLLCGTPATRGLRTVNPYRPHPPLPLARGYSTDLALSTLRTALLELVVS